MIETKSEVYNLRSGGTSKIYIRIIENYNDSENKCYKLTVQDYVKDADGNESIIHNKIVVYSYAERDLLKQQILQNITVQGTESEVNEVLLPYALLFVTQQKPIYNLTANDFQIMQEYEANLSNIIKMVSKTK